MMATRAEKHGITAGCNPECNRKTVIKRILEYHGNGSEKGRKRKKGSGSNIYLKINLFILAQLCKAM